VVEKTPLFLGSRGFPSLMEPRLAADLAASARM
jgi:hypothetical protein